MLESDSADSDPPVAPASSVTSDSIASSTASDLDPRLHTQADISSNRTIDDNGD